MGWMPAQTSTATRNAVNSHVSLSPGLVTDAAALASNQPRLNAATSVSAIAVKGCGSHACRRAFIGRQYPRWAYLLQNAQQPGRDRDHQVALAVPAHRLRPQPDQRRRRDADLVNGRIDDRIRSVRVGRIIVVIADDLFVPEDTGVDGRDQLDATR